MAYGEIHNAVIEMCGGIEQSLLNVLILKLGIFLWRSSSRSG
jgi:hypothetical protein